MITEQAIMGAVVRVDMFLISAWKYALIVLALMGLLCLTAIMMARKKK